MRAEEDKINLLFDNFDKLTIPNSAFVTFENDDSKEYLIMYTEAKEKTSTIKLLGEDVEFKETSEPTDIIWENRNFTDADYFRRQLIAFLIIIVLLFGSFVLIYAISAWSAELNAVFPPSQNCDEIDATYGNELQTYAGIDYFYI